MRSRLIRRGVSSLTAIVIAATLAGTLLVAQTGARWTPPLNPDGHPDLEGVWENNSATPLERPAQLAAKPRLTDDELEAMKRRAVALFTAESDAVFGDALYLNLLADRRHDHARRTDRFARHLDGGYDFARRKTVKLGAPRTWQETPDAGIEQPPRVGPHGGQVELAGLIEGGDRHKLHGAKEGA